MKSSKVPRPQLQIDFDYDDRAVRLALEISVMLAPHVFLGEDRPGRPEQKIALRDLSTRIALLALQRARTFVEPAEKMLCHSCDAGVGPDERVRVTVCHRCAFEGGTPGSSG